MADVCVIGGGPAGSVFASRMAELGHDVCLIERERFPRSRLGESLSPGVMPLLATIGAHEGIAAAGFRRVRSVLVRWDHELRERRDPREQGLLVDRGRFDAILLERARALGVRVMQPAVVRGMQRDDSGWCVRVEAEGRSMELRADFVADARGRSAGRTARRRRTGCRTLALYAYWRGSRLPEHPRIEAGEDAWYWGVPLPDGTYNTLVFVDAHAFHASERNTLTARFTGLIDRSGLMDECRDARMVTPVLATDATPCLDADSVTPHGIKVGEAALAIDPLSSSGVQKAIQGALAGAVVANTLLEKPGSSDAAIRFYERNLADASERHCGWAAERYGAVAQHGASAFWRDRGPAVPGAASVAREPPVPHEEARCVALSRDLEFVDLPCIEGDFVAVKPAVRHPALEGPVAYLGGWELAPLLRDLPAGLTPLEVAQSWSQRIPLASGLEIAGWLVRNGILVGDRAGMTRPAA